MSSSVLAWYALAIFTGMSAVESDILSSQVPDASWFVSLSPRAGSGCAAETTTGGGSSSSAARHAASVSSTIDRRVGRVLSDAFSSREPGPASLESALAGFLDRGLVMTERLLRKFFRDPGPQRVNFLRGFP